MAIDFARARPLLKACDLRRLFIEELGWDHAKQSLVLTIAGQGYELAAFAKKCGVVAYRCQPAQADGAPIPDRNTRVKIHRELAKTAYEHILVFVSPDGSTQVWQWVRRDPGRPIACREHTYHAAQPGDALLQKLQALAVSLEEEEQGVTLPDVTARTRVAFDVERVTKRFYDQFQKEHAAFLKFIEGIEAVADREWYASVMLNRLMFVYFIQRKGFLDGDPHYLRNRLTRCQAERGKDKFYSFYRYFLIRLFHEGFGSKTRTTELEKLLGRIPYLNGGLFDVHELEKPERYGKSIQIPDKVFERIFGYFDQYHWHLDERPLRADNEINPDVLGYIFEKYINQKQMGAYYTKEDITGYISQNTVIPFLFDAAHAKCKVAFENPKGPTLWNALKDTPDRYIYGAVQKGVGLPLPAEIAAGLNDVSKRKAWNKPAPPEYGLPTEIWREVVARRQRYEEIKKKLLAGEVRDINDLITLNLDIRQFAQDIIENCEGPELLRAFWHAIENVTILDPTCGSGAFLFAALNILEPLYEACLERMEAFLEDEAAKLEKGKLKRTPHGYPQLPHGKFEDFSKLLDRVAEHPSARYFIFKNIILNNLFGVDIMEEAVEICKLRLFLKLAAQVEPDLAGPNLGIEPLPDIDFNIRAGNTLVGYANLEEIKKSMEGDWVRLQSLSAIEENAEIADRAFQKFHEMQTEQGMEAKDFSDAKLQLRKRLKALEDELNRYLAQEYGVDPAKRTQYEKWLISHKPFHWFIEFYGIMKAGGFDVIIGNPPWAEYSKVKKEYTIRNYSTEDCGNLHGICTERVLKLRKPDGLMSFIVQLPLTSSSRMSSVRGVLRQRSGRLFAIPFDDRPGKLFEGLQNCRSVIFISKGAQKVGATELDTTRYQRWATEARSVLFALLDFTRIHNEPIYPEQFPKYASSLEDSLFQKVKMEAGCVVEAALSRRATKHFIFYQEATRYWVKATVGLPYYAKNGSVGAPAHGRYLYFNEVELSPAICALLNSSLFYAYFIAYGDCFHLSDTLVSGFPVTEQLLHDPALSELSKRLMRDLKANAERKTITTKDGDKITYDEFFVSKSKPIIDEIDRVLAKHYGFTEEELDFIINYDIKYRMGQGTETDNGE